MKNFLFAAVAVCVIGMSGLVAKAADEKLTGVLIDNKCGAGKDEAAAAGHKATCASKEACASSGFSLIVGDKHYKLDDKGNDQAKAYLASATSTKVTIEGAADGENLKVSSIAAAGGDDKGDKPKKGKKKGA